jgi:hypothetical protein
MKKKLITALIVIIVILILVGVANLLVSNIDIAGLLKSLHGG